MQKILAVTFKTELPEQELILLYESGLPNRPALSCMSIEPSKPAPHHPSPGPHWPLQRCAMLGAQQAQAPEQEQPWAKCKARGLSYIL